MRYVRVVLDCLRVERELLHERMAYPECFVRKDGGMRVDIRWTSKQNKMKIVELVVGLVLVGELRSPQGVLLNDAALVAMIEDVFGVCLGNFSQLKDQLFSRKKELTPFLNQMMKAIELEADKRNALPDKLKK